MEQFCKTLGYIIYILGTIGSFMVAKSVGDIIRGNSFILIALVFISFEFAVVVQGTMMVCLGEILSYVQSLKVYTEVAVENSNGRQDEKLLTKGGWKCSKCGKVNPQYTGTCSCGEARYK